MISDASDVMSFLPDNHYVYLLVISFADVFCCTSHRHKLSFFDGQLDDHNMKDVTTEIIPFASLSPLRLRVKSRTRKTRGRERTKSAVYAGVEYSLMNDHKIKPRPKGSFYSIFCEKIGLHVVCNQIQ